MSAETLTNQPLNTPANDDLHQLHTIGNNGGSVTLRDSVEVALTNYFEQLDGAPVSDVYQLVLSEVEAPLLEQVMKYTRNNQTKASTMLGLNRGTLRKKLKQYGLL
ncbi:DNA-binding transcriptional regulator Fis [Marinobacter fuscus]|uniref:Putative Fis-like DNA-binding protein n=1 Tax=Marinobacter fuscus TaxID=2109942 RepID=A0A2T1KE09_9GAMM|nr:DNA-binding transcriptional regulator Fis [Marinobacter fuscus]PSF08290.1 DNA-binding transcriptional regulator Fis [Marinobacter fuscus]